MGRTDDYMRAVQDDDTPTVTFPDDYPNSVRHFLLIGFLGMFIGAIVFFYMGISRKVNTVMHVLTFFVAAVSACAYYAEWAGLGVEYKTTDTTPRVIFWAHYLDWVVTGPVRTPRPPLHDRNRCSSRTGATGPGTGACWHEGVEMGSCSSGGAMESEEGEDEGRARGTGQAGGGCGCSRLSLFAGSCTARSWSQDAPGKCLRVDACLWKGVCRSSCAQMPLVWQGGRSTVVRCND